MDNGVITTRTCKIWVDKEGIIQNKVLPGAEITLADAKITVKAIGKVTMGGKKPMLVDTSQVKSITGEARQYLAGKEIATMVSVTAIVIGSPISKMIGNFFVNFSKPLTLTKLFTNKSKAIVWLKNFL